MIPVNNNNLWYNEIFFLRFLIISISLYLFIFGVLPIAFRYSFWLQTKLVFLNSIYYPFNFDFTKPELVGLQGARNFYLTTDENVKIGVWQILPQSLLPYNYEKEEYLDLLKRADQPVILYMHGNAGNRGSKHRVALYKLFQKENYHVICFDYRRYGDSDDTAELSETGVVNDSKYVLEWLMKTVNNSKLIYVWGHSLGTGISSHALALLSEKSPAGLFLESPFNNLQDEILFHPFSTAFKYLPWFHWAVVEPLYNNNLRFETDKNFKKIQCPIMILHAEDDKIVPYSLGVKLYEAGRALHPNNPLQVQFTSIKASYKLGHKDIYQYPGLPNVIRNFILNDNTWH